jgi:1-acyl-sn-glycerol-3-phosphate acyltransferase
MGREVLEKPKRVLEAGAVLGLFPEGCLGPTEGTILPLERGIGHILLAADHPVLPVAISGVQELYLRKQVSVRIGEPLRVAVEGLGHHQAIDAAVEQVTVALRRLLPAYQEPRPAFKAMRFLSNLLDIGLPKKPAQGGE